MSPQRRAHGGRHRLEAAAKNEENSDVHRAASGYAKRGVFTLRAVTWRWEGKERLAGTLGGIAKSFRARQTEEKSERPLCNSVHSHSRSRQGARGGSRPGGAPGAGEGGGAKRDYHRAEGAVGERDACTLLVGVGRYPRTHCESAQFGGRPLCLNKAASGRPESAGIIGTFRMIYLPRPVCYPRYHVGLLISCSSLYFVATPFSGQIGGQSTLPSEGMIAGLSSESRSAPARAAGLQPRSPTPSHTSRPPPPPRAPQAERLGLARHKPNCVSFRSESLHPRFTVPRHGPRGQARPPRPRHPPQALP